MRVDSRRGEAVTSECGPPGPGEVSGASGDKDGQHDNVHDVNKSNSYDIPAEGLKLLHLNVCQLSFGWHYVNDVPDATPPKFLAFSETLLTNIQDHVVALPGYTLHRRDRENREGGDIVVQICNTLPDLRRIETENPQTGRIWLELKPK